MVYKTRTHYIDYLKGGSVSIYHEKSSNYLKETKQNNDFIVKLKYVNLSNDLLTIF